MVQALATPGCFAGSLDRRQKQRYQNPDDGNHHQELNQSKTVYGCRSVEPRPTTCRSARGTYIAKAATSSQLHGNSP
jgi:hypothetical protein